MAVEISLRLVRKGVLAAETYSAFQDWDIASPLDENLERFIRGQFKTLGWAREVHATLCIAASGILQSAIPLIILAQRGLPFEEWQNCLLIWMGIREQPFRDFVTEWLYSQFEQGTYRLRVGDVRPFLKSFWDKTHDGSASLSDYGEVRTARDLLRMSRDFGLLTGDGPDKSFASFHLSDRWLPVLGTLHRGARMRYRTCPRKPALAIGLDAPLRRRARTAPPASVPQA